MKSKEFLLKISFLYTLIFIIFIAIPAYFYTQLEIENYKSQQNRLLYEYSITIQNAIETFSTSKDDTFIFPKSFKYEAELLNANNEVIFKTTHSNLNRTNDVLQLKLNLSPNRLNATSIVVSHLVSYETIYLKILVLSVCIAFFIFTSIYLIIKSSIEPYKKANEYLDAFFNDAMHELKTPLGVIQLNLEILEEKHPHSKELIRSMNATKNLFLVYEDIEYLIKQKSVNYNKEWLDFSYILTQRIDQFESLAKTKNLFLNQNIDENIKLDINRIQLQRIIDNTLSNAIKYSFKDTSIYIELLENEQNICFKVNNVGEIIKDKKQIFNRYYKENSIKGGFGIGLNIVKNICQENNIEILVDSSHEDGTTFQYTFLKNT